MRATYRESRLVDALRLGGYLRKEDREELSYSSPGRAPAEVLAEGVGASIVAWTVLSPQEDVVCMVGLCGSPDGSGRPWLIGSDLCRTYARDVLRMGKLAIPIFDGLREVQRNVIDTNNTLHVRWIEHLGFSLREGEEGQRFRTFERQRRRTPCAIQEA